MTELLKRLHIWIGLFNFTALLVMAATGLALTFPGHEDDPAEVRFVDYRAQSDATDRQIADDLFERLKLPIVAPIADWAVHRNEENVLVLEFNGPNGVHRATVLEREHQVRIEHLKSSWGEFFDRMHGSNVYGSPPDWRIRLWSIYVDLSIFSLLFMVATGLWLWIQSRPHLWWARASFGAGSLVFIVLWFVTR